MKTQLIALLLAATLCSAADNMKAFPPADAGMTRHVLNLPKEPDEGALKVELILGKMVNLDSANRYFFGGKLKGESIKGWGFTRYVLTEIGPMAGTEMAPDPSAPKVNRFITLGGEPYLVRYNSKLPAVVYVPSDVEVRYRIWRADPKPTEIPKG